MPEDIDYLVCKSCESPCYVFELDKESHVVSAYCQVCGADEPESFLPPDDDADDDS